MSDIPSKREEPKQVWDGAKNFVRDYLRSQGEASLKTLVVELKERFTFNYPSAPYGIIKTLDKQGQIHVSRVHENERFYAYGPGGGPVTIVSPVRKPEPEAPPLEEMLKEINLDEVEPPVVESLPEPTPEPILHAGFQLCYRCDQCGKEFPTKVQLDGHKGGKHAPKHEGNEEEAIQRAMQEVTLNTARTILQAVDEELVRALNVPKKAKIRMVISMAESAGIKLDMPKGASVLEQRDALKQFLKARGQ